jgi:predicted DNA-binding transcriptional regulator AlpA
MDDPAVDSDRFLKASAVAARYGINSVCLGRWQASTGFPAPIHINGQRYWRLSDLESWERDRASARAVA